MDLSTRILQALARVGRRELARYCSPRVLGQSLETGLQDSREVLELMVLASLPPSSPDVSEPAGRAREVPRPAWEGAPPEERLELQRRALWELCTLVDVTSGEAGLEPDEAFSACGRLGAVLDPGLRDEAVRMLFQFVPETYFAVNAVAALCESFPPKPKAAAMRAVWRELQAATGYPRTRSELVAWLRDLKPPSRAPAGPHVLGPEKEPVSVKQLVDEALFGPMPQRVKAVVSLLEVARGRPAHERVFEALVSILNDPSVYGEPAVHAALGDCFDEVSRLPESGLVEYLRLFQPVLLRILGAPGPAHSSEGPRVPRGKDGLAVVREDELEPNDRLELCYGGVPFTGMAVDFHRHGVKSSEISYVEGVQSGVARDYAEDGRVVYEAHHLNGALHGVARKWYPDGVLESEAVYEFGIEVSRREWDAKGTLKK